MKESRGGEVTIGGLNLAAEKGILRTGHCYGHDCFIITDKTIFNGDCRRLQQYKFNDGAKSKSLPGAYRKWPVGVLEMSEGNYPYVMFVEGSGDALTAISIIHDKGREDVAVVAMLGASNTIPADCLDHFRGRSICIYPHNDEAGMKALTKWSAQLELVTDELNVFDLSTQQKSDGTPVKDLGELYTSIKQSTAGQAVSLLPQ